MGLIDIANISIELIKAVVQRAFGCLIAAKHMVSEVGMVTLSKYQ